MSRPNTHAMLSRFCRSTVSIIAGIAAISLLVESIEFALVALLNGGATTDPQEYYGIRNQNGFLFIKLVYNFGGAIAGGFIAAAIARYAPIRHGVALAVLQTAAFGFALTQPQISEWLPLWMWAALMVVTAVGIVSGAGLASRTSTAKLKQKVQQ